MNNILDAVKESFSNLNTSIGFVGSVITIFDHFKNKNSNHIQETLDAIREKSGMAYARYCEYRKYRQDDLGIPLEEDILGYWELCLRRNVLPSAGDMVTSQIASREEAEIIISYLLEQWMTIPDFSAWIHDVLIQNHLETISERLADLPQILEAASRIKTHLDNQGICDIGTLITPGYVTDAKISCTDLTVKKFFTVDNNFHTMFQVISANADVPHNEAVQAVEEFIQGGTPVIIAGNGGQGKTSLMMRVAVQRASSGRLTFWLSLSNKEIITEQMADRFFDCLIKLTPPGQSTLLCIDNPFEGRASFSSLQARWPHNSKIHLLMAERENRLTLLADPDQDLLLRWFDNAGVVVLEGIRQTRKFCLKDYPSRYFSEIPERRKSILKKCTSYLVKEGAISEEDQLSVINRTLGKYGKPNVSLVELIYRTLFELKKISSKPGSIKLDWEEWGDLIHREFGKVDTDIQLYGVIAALKVFNTSLSLSLFCKRFEELSERKLRTRLCERFVSNHVEPVVYQEGKNTLQPKHDVIAELFFLFNKSKVTIDSVICDLLDVMNENEIEEFLSNFRNKKEVKKGRKDPIGDIDYWGYLERIYSRTQEGNLNLSPVGRAYLCLGVLWAKRKSNFSVSSFSVETVLGDLAPEIENDLLLAKLYTEWGIWLANRRDDSAAEEKFLSVLKYNPKELPSRTELGRLLSRQKGREKEAEEYLLEIIKIDPKNIQSRTELGRLLSRQKGREKEAEEYLKEAIKIEPQHIQSRTELGRLLSGQKGREKEAEEYLKEAIKIDPRNLHPHTELGRLLSRQKGREKEAEEYLKEAIKIEPQHIQSRTELGRLLSGQKGREKEAEEYLKEAIKIDSRQLHSRTVLARLYERKNRFSEARQLYQELCNIDPGNRYGVEGLSRLKSH